MAKFKDISKNQKRTCINLALVIVIILVVLLVVSHNGDIETTWDTLIHANPVWIGAAFGAWFVFMMMDAVVMQAFFIQQGVKIKFYQNVIAALIGMFYSNVTPAATGGQPMQVLSLKRKKINPGVSSSCMAVKFFCWQVALLLTGTVLWILNPGVSIKAGTVPFIALGYVLNGAAVVVVLLLVINPKAVTGLVNFFLRVGCALHLVKDKEASRKKLEYTIEEFNASVDMIKNRPFQLLRLIGIEVCQVVALMSITYCVYRAVGLGEAGYFDMLTLQTLLYIAVSFFPLPGAAGAQELGFGGFFKELFGVKTSAAMLIWRFFTYYIMILLGMLGVFADSVHAMRSGSAANMKEFIAQNQQTREEHFERKGR